MKLQRKKNVYLFEKIMIQNQKIMIQENEMRQKISNEKRLKKELRNSKNYCLNRKIF